jgi:phosphatidylinositol kinase/protein kinase (PI-3  family)
MVAVLGGVGSCAWRHFVELTCRAFLVARAYADELEALVCGMADSALPAFAFPDTLRALRARLVPHLTDAEASAHMRRLIADAAGSVRTVLYDGVQRLQQGIHSQAWL